MANVYQQYLTALQIATEYDRVIIPEAELAYQELLQSYKANRVDWPTVLEAQMDYFNARLTRVQHLEQVRTNEVLVRGFLLHGGLMAAPGPTPQAISTPSQNLVNRRFLFNKIYSQETGSIL